jgi:Deltex C-terminal domain
MALLIEAFRRKLTFIVGTSQTTGQTNVVCWAGLHHKTSPNGGTFGWPDATYFQRIRSELTDRGVVLTPQIVNAVNINQGKLTVQ